MSPESLLKVDRIIVKATLQNIVNRFRSHDFVGHLNADQDVMFMLPNAGVVAGPQL
jgi:hypothetical protein